MSNKDQFALYAVELTEKENGSVWITVTQQEPYVVFSAQLATGTWSVTYETIQPRLKERLNISDDRRL